MPEADDEPTGRDLRTIWRTIAIIAVAGVAVAGGGLAAVVREVRQDTRLEALERWQAAKDAEAEAERRAERWRRNRDGATISPGVRP